MVEKCAHLLDFKIPVWGTKIPSPENILKYSKIISFFIRFFIGNQKFKTFQNI